MIAVMVADVTVNEVDPVSPPKPAVMVTVPVDCEVANPAVLTAATAGFVDPHEAEVVTSCVLSSLNLAMALNCSVVPRAIDCPPGFRVIETRVGCDNVTVRTVEPVTDCTLALMVAVPVPTAEESPAEPILATPVFEDVQVAEFVRSCVLPSLKVPVAVNCWLPPTPADGFAGVTAIVVNTA